MRDRIASRYELREKLGASATATVWRARDRRRRRDVALKVANNQPTDVSSRRQLAAEADAAGRLNHPNIVPLLDAHIGRDEAALAFSYVGGETLARRLAHAGRVNPKVAAGIALDIASALAHAHARGVVHRDVKPGNVIIDREGHARLFDFGISATPERPNAALVEPGMTTGTLPYMAPEQLAGQPADPATDVCALGAVLYEMLSGHRPFGASITDELATQQQRPPAPVDDAPAPLVELAAAALTPDPKARPSASAFARRLRAWQSAVAEAETALVPTVPSTTVVPAVSPAAAGASPVARARSVVQWPSPVVLAAAALVMVAVLAGALALAAVIGRVPASTAPPASVAPVATSAPTIAPIVQDGGGSGGGGGNHGGNGHASGHGKGALAPALVHGL